MLTYFPKNILLIGTVADLSPFRRLKTNFKMYVHMYICMYICTYHVRLIWTLMPGKHKYDKDKSNGDLLWHLCPEKFWFFRTALIGEMSYIIAAHCICKSYRLPIYVLLLSGNNCLLYSSISISFKSITRWKWNQNFWQTYWHCIKLERKLMLLTLRKFKLA